MPDHGTATYTLGQYNEVLCAIAKALPKALAGIPPREAIIASRNGDSLAYVLRDAIHQLQKNRPFWIEYSFAVVVDYDVPVAEAVRNGEYDCAEEHAREISSLPNHRRGKDEVTIHLAHFRHHYTTGQMLQEIQWAEYRPAESLELLALEARYRERLQEFSLIGFNNPNRAHPGNDSHAVLELYTLLGQRHLRCSIRKKMEKFGSYWPPGDRFAIISEQ